VMEVDQGEGVYVGSVCVQGCVCQCVLMGVYIDVW